MIALHGISYRRGLGLFVGLGIGCLAIGVACSLSETEPVLQGGDPLEPEPPGRLTRRSSFNAVAKPVPKIGEYAAPDYGARFLAASNRAPQGYSVVGEAPFVIVTNLPMEERDRVVGQTIRPGFNFLRRRFLRTLPTVTPILWLFVDKISYENQTLQMFGEFPRSPFGFYRPDSRELLANMATGGGTLLHEMTHALMHDDFNGVPMWFSEGFASLWEQCELSADQGVSRVNWRLSDLARLLRRGFALPPIAELCRMNRGEFYLQMRRNYAMARYLCLWLQDQDKLVPFYKAFRDAFADGSDATGAKTLATIVGPLSDLDTRLTAYVKELIVSNLPPDMWPD